MRWLPVLLSCLALPLGSLAAKKSNTDTFEEFHKKALSSSPIRLNDPFYKKLTTAPRDYSVGVLLTALDAKYGCELCNKFQPEWEVLAKSWTRGDKKGESRLILGTLDFSDGRETFMSLGVQSAPQLLLFQPTTGPNAVASSAPYLQYDFSTGALTAETVATWLGRHLPNATVPPMYRPFDYVSFFVKVVSFLGVLGVGIRLRDWVLWTVQSRTLWASITLIFTLMFISGQMYNQIRRVPYIQGDGRGGISYFAPGFQSQYGLETQIVAFVYGLLSFGTIALAIKAPRIQDSYKQQFMIFGWGAVVVLLYSYLMSVFRIKNGGYPFSLPPFL